ncbi:MAG: hypothetical protein HY719_05815, partial [Planctomycetes bacterium]|nr:hypothetical protein [Planctomycetota bacterium]
MNLFRRALAGGVTAAALLALALALASGCAAEPAEETQEIAAVVREIDAPPLAPTEEEIGARRALERRVRAAAERLDRATTATRRETLDDLAALGPAAAPAVRALLAPRHPLEAEALLARWKESG